MAAKTIKQALNLMLEDLSKEDFNKFCAQLLDRRAPPRVRRSQVEDKSRIQISDVLVCTFTEVKALSVALEVLRDIGCNHDAEDLEQTAAALSSPPGSAAGPGVGLPGGDTKADDKHFVDKHQVQLIQRVSNIEPILDELLTKGILQQESYDRVRTQSTSQGKMRELYSGCLKAGDASKDVFYKLLLENEKFLMEDLKKKE